MTDKNERLSLLSELIKLANADESLKEVEFKFLLVIASQLGISKEEYMDLFEQHIEFNPPKLEADRILQFHRLVLLMNIDTKANEAELDYIRDLGIRMGLNPMATNYILKNMDQYPNRIIPTEQLIEIFKTYHN